MSVLKSFLDGTLAVIRYDTDGLSKDAADFLSVAEGSWPSQLLADTGLQRVRGFMALHELVRLEYFETRDNTFVELLASSPRAANSGRIEERANAAAVDELHKVLALHPGVTFGVARCDEVDFAGIWQLPIYAAAGAGDPGVAGRRIHRSHTFGILTMDAYRFD